MLEAHSSSEPTLLKFLFKQNALPSNLEDIVTIFPMCSFLHHSSPLVYFPAVDWKQCCPRKWCWDGRRCPHTRSPPWLQCGARASRGYIGLLRALHIEHHCWCVSKPKSTAILRPIGLVTHGSETVCRRKMDASDGCSMGVGTRALNAVLASPAFAPWWPTQSSGPALSLLCLMFLLCWSEYVQNLDLFIPKCKCSDSSFVWTFSKGFGFFLKCDDFEI